MSQHDTTHVVVCGGGFAGTACVLTWANEFCLRPHHHPAQPLTAVPE